MEANLPCLKAACKLDGASSSDTSLPVRAEPLCHHHFNLEEMTCDHRQVSKALPRCW